MGNFTSHGFELLLRSFCTESSSRQISAILFGQLTGKTDSLRNSPQNFRRNCAETYATPGSQHFLDPSRKEPGHPAGAPFDEEFGEAEKRGQLGGTTCPTLLV